MPSAFITHTWMLILGTILLLTTQTYALVCATECRAIFPNCTNYWSSLVASKPEYVCQSCDTYFRVTLKKFSPALSEIKNGLPAVEQQGACIGYDSDPAVFIECNSLGILFKSDKTTIDSYRCLNCSTGFAPNGTISYSAEAVTYSLCESTTPKYSELPTRVVWGTVLVMFVCALLH